MECRCYHGGEGRTKMKLLRYKRRDYLTFIALPVLLAAVIVMVNFGL
jgi:energy-coupling factor transport system permease protein